MLHILKESWREHKEMCLLLQFLSNHPAPCVEGEGEDEGYYLLRECARNTNECVSANCL